MLLASTSTEGGRPGTWSRPTLVNPRTDKAAFAGSTTVNEAGKVGVTYYDLTPQLTSPDVLLTDTWFTSTTGPGLDFGPRKLIGGPFNMEAALIARGFFVGGYEGITAPVAAEDDKGNRAQSVPSSGVRAGG